MPKAPRRHRHDTENRTFDGRGCGMNRRASRTIQDTRQADLLGDGYFQVPAPPLLLPGSMQCGAEICGALKLAIRNTDLSRAEIAARMTDLTAEPITEFMLNDWTAPSHRHRFPAEYMPALEAACETTALQAVIARKSGSVVLVGKEALDAQLGRLTRQKHDLARQEQQIKALMRRL